MKILLFTLPASEYPILIAIAMIRHDYNKYIILYTRKIQMQKEIYQWFRK